ncbi:hypothetical protein ABT121_09335 [Streptomyces sp. NPDC001928]|uniref:hypothetical protein n=1 Tax=Streptomyces sp. NPDC001928 TaxID=3154404 RepID=UPI0033228CD6
MRMHDGERSGEQVQVQMQVRDGEGDPVPPGVDELTARFQGQSDPGFARERSRQARNARGSLMVAGAMVALVCLFVIVGRLSGGTPAGVWTAVYGAGVGFTGLAVELARRGHTRWATLGVVMGAVCGSLGDGLLP